MISGTQYFLDETETAPSLYDVSAVAELWFQPGPSLELHENLPPLPTSEHTRLFERPDWLAAQGLLSGDLAAAALVQGRLAERMARAGEGARLRLALEDVVDLGWLTGARFGAERLALFVALRAAAGEEGQASGQAAWVVRRLTSGAEPGAVGWSTGLPAFLGFDGEAILTLAEVMADTEALHPLTRAALLLHGWRLAGEVRLAHYLEVAALAERHGSLGAPFLPLGLAGGAALRGHGSPEARLAAFYRGAEQVGLAALRLVDRVKAWQWRAEAACSGLSGKTPRELIEVFARWPMVSAAMVEAQTQASRAAVQRNLDLLVARKRLREITGQGRYRIWTAAL